MTIDEKEFAEGMLSEIKGIKRGEAEGSEFEPETVVVLLNSTPISISNIHHNIESIYYMLKKYYRKHGLSKYDEMNYKLEEKYLMKKAKVFWKIGKVRLKKLLFLRLEEKLNRKKKIIKKVQSKPKKDN